MIENDWLYQIATPEGLESALQQLPRLDKFTNRLHLFIPDLIKITPQFENELLPLIDPIRMHMENAAQSLGCQPHTRLVWKEEAMGIEKAPRLHTERE